MTTMEFKKTESKVIESSTKKVEIEQGSKAAEKGKFRDYIQDIKSEIKKIDWTSKDELKVYTKIVVIATFWLGMGIYAVDLTIQSLLSLITVVFHWVVG